MSAFDEIEVKKDGGDAAGPEADGQTPPDAEVQASAETQDPLVESQDGAAGEGARDAGGGEAQATTDEQVVFTGRETPEAMAQRYGPEWAVKFARRISPLVSQAGGTQNLRHGAEIAAAIHDPAVTAEQFDELGKGVSPARWEELRLGLAGRALSEELPDERFTALVRAASPFIWRAVGENADVVVKGLLEDDTATLAEVREALTDYRAWKGQQQGAEQAPDADDLSTLPPNLRKKLEDYDRLMQEVPGLREQVSGMVERQKTEEQRQTEAKVNELGQELYREVFSVVEKRRSELGLDVLPTDSPRVAGIKRALASHLSDDKLEAAFDANPDNLRLAQLAQARVRALEREGAFSYADALKVGAELTLEEALKSDAVASLLAALKSEMESQSTPKNPTARPEMVAGAAASFTPENPFAKGREEGLNPFDVSERLAGQRSAQAGR